MGIPAGYSRTVFSGSLPNGEIWASGFWCNEAPSSEAATQDQATTFGTELTNAWSHAGAPAVFNVAGMTVDKTTAYSYLDGSGKASFVGEQAMSLAGASSQAQLPNQCSIVTTLLTGSAGRRARGRMYWPCTAPDMADGEMASGDVTLLATWMATLIGSLNGHLGDQAVVVLSQVAGTSKPVSAIKVDSRIDIQRRRANKETILFTSTHSV